MIRKVKGKKPAKKNAVRDNQPPSNGVPSPQSNDGLFIWNDNDPPAANYMGLAKRLVASGDLFRSPAHGNGLILLLPGGKSKPVRKEPTSHRSSWIGWPSGSCGRAKARAG